MNEGEHIILAIAIGLTIGTELVLIFALGRIIAFLNDWGRIKAFLIDEWRRNR